VAVADLAAAVHQEVMVYLQDLLVVHLAAVAVQMVLAAVQDF
jgi:hypothetical protein